MGEKSDFNDLAKSRGKLSVAKKINFAIDADKGLPIGNFIIRPDGNYLITFDRDGKPKDPIPFSSPLAPQAVCRSNKGDGFGLLFELRDLDGNIQEVILRSEDLHVGAGEIHRTELARRGVWFAPGTRKSVYPDFYSSILKHSKALPRLTVSTKNGWHQIGGIFVYIFNAETTGSTDGEKVIHPAMPNPADFAPAGTLATAQTELFRYAATNSRLMLALCTSFTGVILEILQAEPGIIHLFGASSIAKTTALYLALSVWGNPRDLLKTWNSTGNALVALLSQRNDGLLALDEMGLCAPEQAGNTVYAWTSGNEKSRLKQDATLRDTKQFCTMGLSTGEQTLSDFMRQSRHNLRPAAGQEVRMIDVPADPGAGLGLFDDLCCFADGAALSNHIKAASLKNHGAAIRVFLKRLVEDRNDRPEQLHETLTGTVKRFLASYLPPGADGQVHRVCHRFGIIAAAGEIAAQYGVLPFPEGDASANIGECFNSWLSRRGTSGKLEITRLLDQVSAFFEKSGENCFVSLAEGSGERSKDSRPVVDRFGFRRPVPVALSEETRTEYFVFSLRFKEIVTGFDPSWAAQVLKDRGIIRGTGDRPTVVKALPGMGKPRVYHFHADGDIVPPPVITLDNLPF